MSKSETLVITLFCKSCNNKEIKEVAERGHPFKEECWDRLGGFMDFDADIEQKGRAEPSVKEAKCKKCGKNAEINEEYHM